MLLAHDPLCSSSLLRSEVAEKRAGTDQPCSSSISSSSREQRCQRRGSMAGAVCSEAEPHSLTVRVSSKSIATNAHERRIPRQRLAVAPAALATPLATSIYKRGLENVSRHSLAG